MQSPSPRVILFALFVLTSAFGCERRPSTVLIGHLAPMSGADRERGLAAVRGVQLAVETINADKNQLVAGYRIAVLHADTKSDLTTCENQAVRLATINKVSTIIGGDTREQMARLKPVARDYNVTIVGPAGGAGSSSNLFGLGVSLDQRVEAIAALLAKQPKESKLLLMVDRRDAELTAAADRLADAIRAHIPSIEALPFKDRNEFYPSLQRKPLDIVLYFGTAQDLAVVAKAIAKPRMMLYAGDEADWHHLLNEPSSDGCFVLGSMPATPVADADKAFMTAYQSRFAEPPTMEARRYWDALQVPCAAIREAKSLQADKLVPKLRELKTGARLSGPFVIGPDQVARGPVFVLQIKNGQLVDHERIEPTPDKKAP